MWKRDEQERRDAWSRQPNEAGRSLWSRKRPARHQSGAGVTPVAGESGHVPGVTAPTSPFSMAVSTASKPGLRRLPEALVSLSASMRATSQPRSLASWSASCVVAPRRHLHRTCRGTVANRPLPSARLLLPHRRELLERRGPGHDHRQFPSCIGIRTPRSTATSSARSYPASTCRITPIPGSFLSTRASFWAASTVPSATETCPE